MTKTSLTEKQKYLLNRIPSRHDLNGMQPIPEPAKVKQARKIIERFDKMKSLKRCQQEKRNEALIRKAREAVYFKTPEIALQIIRQVEKMLKGCPV